jgi:ribose transport system ATP-binding protein
VSTSGSLAHSPAPQGGDILLSVESVSKSYPGTQALDGASFTVKRGEIHALAGQNGAGKSTFIRILAGVESADTGSIRFAGQVARPQDRSLPINFIHQDLGLVEAMTVAENLALSTGYPRRGGLIDWGELDRQARKALAVVGCDVDPRQVVGELTTAERSVVALARAIMLKADLIVLDEPTAALPAGDVDTLFRVLRRLRENGVSALYVTHRLDEIFALADSVTVMRDGKVVASRAVAEVSSEELVALITGRSVDQLFPTRMPPRSNVLLSVKDVVVDHFAPVSFDGFAGEVLALVGLRGAGHEVLGRAIFGAHPFESGSIKIAGEDRAGSIREAIARGVGFASGRRAQESLALTLQVRENLFLNPNWVGTKSLSFRGRERQQAKELVRKHRVWPQDSERMTATLSGGNQQKVVFARWAHVRSQLLILEDPTAGVDIGARAELYRTIAELCAEGRTCLVVSSDFDEVAGIAHRALVFDRGRIVRELSGDDLTAENISLYASGGEEPGGKGRE